MLLEVVTDSGNIGCDFNSIGESNASDFAQSGVWFFRCLSGYASANASFLWAFPQSRAARFFGGLLSAFSNELINCGQCRSSL